MFSLPFYTKRSKTHVLLGKLALSIKKLKFSIYKSIDFLDFLWKNLYFHSFFTQNVVKHMFLLGKLALSIKNLSFPYINL